MMQTLTPDHGPVGMFWSAHPDPEGLEMGCCVGSDRKIRSLTGKFGDVHFMTGAEESVLDHFQKEDRSNGGGIGGDEHEPALAEDAAGGFGEFSVVLFCAENSGFSAPGSPRF